MVRHGTAKKRRSGASKVTRKAPKNKAVRVANAVVDKFSKSNWNKAMTPAENLKAMGLDPDPNSVIRVEPIDPNNVGFQGFMEISDNNDLYAVANPKRKKMSEFDQNYILKLYTTYSGDFKKMQRDLKLNYKQCSESQLEKMYKTYSSLPASQKLV